jgi:hypothetical protein
MKITACAAIFPNILTIGKNFQAVLTRDLMHFAHKTLRIFFPFS